MSEEPSTSVRFSSNPEIIEIPRRSFWRRKVKPVKDKCCSACYTAMFFMCYPCVELVRVCGVWCNLCKGNVESDARREHWKDSHSIYVHGMAGPGVMYGSRATQSRTSTKQARQFL